MGGGSEGGGGGGWDPTPPRVPLWSPRRRANIFSAEILLAPKAPKQNFGCQPQTLEGEMGGGGGPGGLPLLFLRCTAVLIHLGHHKAALGRKREAGQMGGKG